MVVFKYKPEDKESRMGDQHMMDALKYGMSAVKLNPGSINYTSCATPTWRWADQSLGERFEEKPPEPNIQFPSKEINYEFVDYIVGMLGKTEAELRDEIRAGL